jgi:hypothetical protein
VRVCSPSSVSRHFRSRCYFRSWRWSISIDGRPRLHLPAVFLILYALVSFPSPKHLILWSVIDGPFIPQVTYHWRASAIRKRGTGPYDDRVGPTIVCFALLGVFWIHVDFTVLELIGHHWYSCYDCQPCLAFHCMNMTSPTVASFPYLLLGPFSSREGLRMAEMMSTSLSP